MRHADSVLIASMSKEKINGMRSIDGQNELYPDHLLHECPSFLYGDKALEALEGRRHDALSMANGDINLVTLYNEQFDTQRANLKALCDTWMHEYKDDLQNRHHGRERW